MEKILMYVNEKLKSLSQDEIAKSLNEKIITLGLSYRKKGNEKKGIKVFNQVKIAKLLTGDRKISAEELWLMQKTFGREYGFDLIKLENLDSLVKPEKLINSIDGRTVKELLEDYLKKKKTKKLLEHIEDFFKKKFVGFEYYNSKKGSKIQITDIKTRSNAKSYISFVALGNEFKSKILHIGNLEVKNSNFNLVVMVPKTAAAINLFKSYEIDASKLRRVYSHPMEQELDGGFRIKLSSELLEDYDKLDMLLDKMVKAINIAQFEGS